MARWKLTEPHYLNVPGTKWEYTMQNRTTGKPQRKVFEVPLYLNPEDESDWNVREGYDGYIAVCHVAQGLHTDIEFIGDPTPGMVPLDDEARTLTAKFKWTPTQGTDEESKQASFQNQLLNGLIDQMSDLQTKATQNVGVPGMEQFMQVMTQMMAQQGAILAALTERTLKEANPLVTVDPDQVVDVEDPLDEAEPTEAELAEASTAAAEREATSNAKAANRMASRRI